MSAADPKTRTKPVPRWSVVRLAGLSPALIAGLAASRAWVRDGPPLLASGPSKRLVPNGKLLALVADGVKPVASRTS